MKNKDYFRWFLYLSLAFLVIALARADYLQIPQIVKPRFLVLSLLLLVVGFACEAFSWRFAVTDGLTPISLPHAIASGGLSIFGKYVPGKIWLIIGRAEYLASRYAVSRMELGMLSLQWQLIYLWAGLAIGSVGTLVAETPGAWRWGAIGLWVVLSVVAVTGWGNLLVERMLGWLLRKQVTVPRLTLSSSRRVLPVVLIGWCSWSAGFSCLATALTGVPFSFVTGTGFVLAATLGIMAIVFPGGLGVREGILSAFLLTIGFGPADAATIALTSRLWFLLGESAYFGAGVIADRIAR